MKKCSVCKKKFPAHLINYFMSSHNNIWVCPICGLKLRNKIHGLPKDTPFHGEMAQEYYKEAKDFSNKGDINEN